MLAYSGEWSNPKKGDQSERLMKLLPGASQDYSEHRKHEILNKADTLDVATPAGSAKGSFLWVRAATGNPFLPFITVIDSGPVSSVALPRLASDPALGEQTSIDPSGFGAMGDLEANIDFDILYWDNHLRASHAVTEDLPGFRDQYSVMAMEQIFTRSGKKVFDDIKASTGVGSANTGAATALPTAANIISKMAELANAVDGQYHPGAVYHVSKEVMALLMNATKDNALQSGFGWPTVGGYPVVVNGAMDNGATAGDVSVIFGDFMYGYLLAIRSDTSVKMYLNNGLPTFYAWVRLGGAVWDEKALAVLKTGA